MGGSQKANIEGEGLAKKGMLGQFDDLRRGLGKKEGGVFEGRLIPQCTLCDQ